MNSPRRHSASFPRRRSPNARRPAFDALERRALLAGPGMTLTLAGHTVAGNLRRGSRTAK